MEEKAILVERDIDRSLDRMSLEIIERNQGVDELVIIGIHTGGVYLARRLHEKIEQHEQQSIPVGSLDITLYRDDWSLISQNPIVKKTDIGFPLDNRRVLLVDDVIFTGRTIRAAMDAMMDYGRPRLIQLAVLVDRGGRELPIQPDFVGVAVEVADDERVDVVLKESSSRDEVIITKR